MNRWLQCLLCCVLSAFVLVEAALIGEAAELRKTENIIFVMTDGFRWQEMFGGVDAAILNEPSNVEKNRLGALKKQFCRETPEASREALLPFIWRVVAKEGQIYGNQGKQSRAQVTNGLKFSYPGYQETLCGFPDPRIDRNDAGPNPNVTVLEWLRHKPAFQGRVAAFGAWNAFNDIFNRRRCGFCVNAGYDPLTQGIHRPEVDLLNQLKAETPRIWKDEPFDAVTFHTALAYFKAARPRVFYLSLGETDDWGHEGKYDEYLTAAHRADAYVKRLWETAQAMPEYRGKTTVIFSPDHGRGSGPKQWRDHAKNVAGAEDIWMAFMGPDTPALGERANVPMVTQSQIAATLAALLGEDYCANVPKAGKPITDVLSNVSK
jgi:hypothetical protein